MLSYEEKEAIKATWKKREKNYIEKMYLRREEANNKAVKIAALLKEKYMVKEVYLYGSLARNGPFDSHSDIDIYI